MKDFWKNILILTFIGIIVSLVVSVIFLSYIYIEQKQEKEIIRLKLESIIKLESIKYKNELLIDELNRLDKELGGQRC